MALGRDRRQERRDERHGGGTVKYQMRQKLLSIGDDYWIEDEAGQRAYKVDGKALRIRDTLVLEDAGGREVAKLQEKMLRIKDAMAIEDGEGNRIAMVKKALITPLRERWHVEVENGSDLDVKGNIVDHEYEFEDDGHRVASVSKKWFRVADTYGVEIEPGVDPVLVLAATVALDMMAHESR